MAEPNLEWYAEGYRNGWLDPEDRDWYEQGLNAGYIQTEQPIGTKSPEDITFDLFQQNLGKGLTYLGDPTGFGEWLGDQQEDLAGYIPKHQGQFLESDDKLAWAAERGLENSFQTALPYMGYAASAAVESFPVPPTPQTTGIKAALIAVINSGVGITNYVANVGDVGSDYEERMKSPEIKGKDYKLDGTDKAAIAGISTIVSALDYVGPVMLDKKPIAKETLKRSLIELATLNPTKFATSVKNLSKEGVAPFLKILGYEMSTEAAQKGISMLGSDIAAGDMRSPNEYANNMISEAVGAVGGGALGSTTQMVTAPSADVKEKTLTHEKGIISKTVDTVADTFARKSVSVLNPYIDVTGEQGAAARLHDILEHREMGDAPGVVKAPDFFESKLTQLGDLYNNVDNALARIRDNFRGTSMSKSTKSLFDSFMENRRQLSPKLQTAVDKAMSGDMTELNSLRGTARKLADTAYAARQVKETISEINNRFDQIGVKKAYSETATGLPLFFNTQNISKNKTAFTSWLQSEGYASNPVHAAEITEGILATGGIPFLNEPIRHKAVRAPKQGEKPGVVNKPFDPNKIPDQFVNKNLETALPKFAMKAATRIAHAQQFGPNGEIINDLVRQMINEVRQSGHRVNDQDIQRIYDIQAALGGTFNPIRQQGISDVNKAVTVFQAFSKLGGATLSSIQEPLIIFERMGLGPALQAIPSAVSHVTRGALRTVSRRLAKEHDMTKVANEIGIAQDYANSEILTQTFSAEHASLLDTFFKSPFGLFLYQWTRFVRSWATGAAMIKFDNYQQEFTSGKVKKLTRQQLADLGFSVQDFSYFTNLVNQSGIKMSDLLKRNAKNPDQVTEFLLDSQLPSGATGRSLLRAGVLRMVNEAVIAPRATVRPMWLNDPHFAIIGELKSFPIVFGNTVVKRLIRKVNPKNVQCGGSLLQGLGALATASALVGAAYAVRDWKYSLFGGKAPEDRPTVRSAETIKDVTQSTFGESVKTSGLLGAWDFAMQAYEHGPSAVLGPSFADVEKLMKEIVKLGEDESLPEDFAKYVGERTAEAMGVFGKNQEFRENVGNYFYDAVY